MEVTDATTLHDPPAELSNLSFESQIGIAAFLLPAQGLGSDAAAWGDLLRLSATSSLMHAAVLEAVRELAPAALGSDNLGPAAFAQHLGVLIAGGGCTRWKALRPLRARRPQVPNRTPLHDPPKLAGASLCTVAPSQLCLFGGRVSESGDTLDSTKLITASTGVAIWDTLHADARPPARCYHTALAWDGASGRRQQGSVSSHMLVFGGAGEGDEGNENLLGDVWLAEVGLGNGAASAAAPPPLSWRELHPSGAAPVARSSHICAAWAATGALIFHGGLATDGVLGDTWLLKGGGAAAEAEWSELHTSGPAVRRAHHSGGLIGESTLVLFSGQDETLGTVHSLASLDLHTAVWSLVALPTDGPCWSTRRQASAGSHCGAPIARIDGSATAIANVGLIIFGGVGDDFGFVPAHDAWLLRSATDVCPQRQLALPCAAPPDARGDAVATAAPAVGPCSRACLGLCADGLRIYLYGGFDGETDLNDLWTLDLAPQAAGAATGTKPAFNADVFKARQKRASAVLHATPGAAGHNSIGMPIHVLVGLAARSAECVDGASSVGRGTLPLVPRTPSTATPAFELGSGLGDGLGRGQRAAVLAAFREDEG